MKTYKIIRFIIIIELVCIFLLVSLGASHASDYQRELFRQTHDYTYLTNASLITYQFQIHLLVFWIIIYVISSIFDMLFKYNRNRFKHTLVLITTLFVTWIIVDIFNTYTRNEGVRNTSSILVTFYLLIVSMIIYYVIPRIHKTNKEITEDMHSNLLIE